MRLGECRVISMQKDCCGKRRDPDKAEEIQSGEGEPEKATEGFGGSRTAHI